jgi:hypothetical protein
MRLLVLTLAVVGFACAGAGPNPTEPTPVVAPILVENVSIVVLESFPAQAVAHVRGVVGDGCSSLHSTDVRRDGNVVTITILRQRPEGAICTQQALLYDENIRLPGDYPPGEYVVRVNGVETRFAT